MTYPSPAFREERQEILHAALQRMAFGLLVTQPETGYATSYLPWELDAARGPRGTLVGHLARYNPQWQVPAAGAPALVVFQGPHAYVSPAWYPGTRTDPRQVPTWDYLAIEARGTLTAFTDAARLRGLLLQLVARHEAGRSPGWRVADAPADYIDAEMRHIVGIEVRIESLVGRYKLSQNRDAADKEGARAGLAAAPTEREHLLAAAIASARDAGPSGARGRK